MPTPTAIIFIAEKLADGNFAPSDGSCTADAVLSSAIGINQRTTVY